MSIKHQQPRTEFEAQANDNHQTSNNVQFLVFYKFNIDSSHQNCRFSDIGVIGMLTYKLEKESFWLTPTALDC